MGYFKTSLKVLSQMIAILVLVSFPITESFARAGCCSHHGGVKGCNSSTGRQLCKDGTTSPSCPCSGYKAKQVKTTTKTTTKTTPVEAPAPVATPATTSKAIPKGCCSRHGGVAQCNTGTGFLMCKDGTQSSSCKCS